MIGFAHAHMKHRAPWHRDILVRKLFDPFVFLLRRAIYDQPRSIVPFLEPYGRAQLRVQANAV